MKFLFVIYIIIISIICSFGIYHSQRTKTFAWVFLIGIILLICSPIIAKFCGLQ